MMRRCITRVLEDSIVANGRLSELQIDFAYDVIETLMPTHPLGERAEASANLVQALVDPGLFSDVTRYFERLDLIVGAIKERGFRFLEVHFREG